MHFCVGSISAWWFVWRFCYIRNVLLFPTHLMCSRHLISERLSTYSWFQPGSVIFILLCKYSCIPLSRHLVLWSSIPAPYPLLINSGLISCHMTCPWAISDIFLLVFFVKYFFDEEYYIHLINFFYDEGLCEEYYIDLINELNFSCQENLKKKKKRSWTYSAPN